MRIIKINFVLLFLCMASSVVSAQTPIYKQKKYSTEERISDLIQRMTIEEKIAQIRHLTSGNLVSDNQFDLSKLEKHMGNGIAYGFVDGFSLTSKNLREYNIAIQKYILENTRLGIPIFTVGESLHGAVQEGATIFPQNIALGSTFNTELAYQRAAMITYDLHYQGTKQVLAPCIDVVRDLRWGRVEESYGEDPYMNGLMAIAEVKGYMDNGISPMLKHYGPHGNPLGGLNLASVECGVRDLLDIYLKPFEMAIKNTNVMAVMSSYNSWNHVPNSASHYLMTEILRDEWGFRGYVYSDWGSISMLEFFHKTAGDQREGAYQALTAGLDVEASSSSYPKIKELIEEGKLSIEVLDTAVERVLRAKFETGLFDDPFGTKYDNNSFHSKESVQLSRKIADESTVLLKNEGGLLPLDRKKLKSIAVLGPNADQVQFGGYTWSRSNKDGVTPLAGLKALLGNSITLNYAKGADMMSLDTSLIPEAVEAAEKSDIALIFCGSASSSLARDYSGTTSGEGFDLHDLNLTGAQSDLIKAVYATGKPIVLVLVAGKPFTIEWEKEHIPAILAQWYAGEQEGASIADILFGNVNPSGHLTFSFPRSVGHLPAYYNHLPSDKGFYKQPGAYGKSGRDYVFSSPSNLWNFGHGLSYTNFNIANLIVEKKDYKDTDIVRTCFEVTNVGDREGKEVIQLYVRDLVSTVVTPVKSLRAFDKIDLKPGEKRVVELNFPISELYIRDNNNRKFIESGKFEIQIGNASDNIVLRDTIFVGDSSNSVKQIKKEDILRKKEKSMQVKGVVRDMQATLIYDVSIFSSLLKREVGKTDKRGNYSIKVPKNDVLIFKKSGYRPLKIDVNGQVDLNISLDYE